MNKYGFLKRGTYRWIVSVTAVALLTILIGAIANAQSVSDLVCVDVLPKVVYLGEYPGGYTLTEGYETFVVKRHNPFRFDVDAGVSSTGAAQYETAPRERVWACSGQCDFTSFKYEPIDMGNLATGVQIELVMLDDDGLVQNNDQRRNWWAVNDPMQPYEIVEDQQMVKELNFRVPMDGHWYFYAADSIGLITRCIQPTPTPTLTPTLTPTETPTSTPTETPTSTPIPTSTPTFIPTTVITPTTTPTNTPTNTPTSTPPVGGSEGTVTPTPIPTAVHPPTAIELVNLTAETHAGGIMLTWETGSELQTLGFYLWRSATDSRLDAIEITESLIPAMGNSNSGALYHYADMSIQPGVHYTYWLQEVQLDGKTVDVGSVQPLFIGNLYLPLISRQ